MNKSARTGEAPIEVQRQYTKTKMWMASTVVTQWRLLTALKSGATVLVAMVPELEHMKGLRRSPRVVAPHAAS